MPTYEDYLDDLGGGVQPGFGAAQSDKGVTKARNRRLTRLSE
jgi:hypothetical protein